MAARSNSSLPPSSLEIVEPISTAYLTIRILVGKKKKNFGGHVLVTHCDLIVYQDLKVCLFPLYL